jgi:hypothetical protein
VSLLPVTTIPLAIGTNDYVIVTNESCARYQAITILLSGLPAADQHPKKGRLANDLLNEQTRQYKASREPYIR